MTNPEQLVADMAARRMVQAMRAQCMNAVAGITPSVGTGSVGALALGATASVVVPLTPELPDTSFVPIVSLFGGAGLLGNLTLLGVTAKTTSSVTVAVRAPLAVSAGASVQVVAFRAA